MTPTALAAFDSAAEQLQSAYAVAIRDGSIADILGLADRIGILTNTVEEMVKGIEARLAQEGFENRPRWSSTPRRPPSGQGPST